MLKEFKDFLLKGNLVEIAVGLILALKIADVVNSLVDDIINPIIGAIVGQPSFATLSINIGDARIAYGNFLSTIVSLVLVGFILFLIVKGYNRLVEMSKRRGEEAGADEDDAQVALLKEIRDTLQRRP